MRKVGFLNKKSLRLVGTRQSPAQLEATPN